MKILFLASDLEKVGGIQKYDRDFLSAAALLGLGVFTLELNKKGLFAKLVFACRVFLGFFRFQPDAVVCSHINFAVLGYLLKFFTTKKYVILTYGIEIRNLNFKKRRYLNGASAVVTISNYTKKRLVDLMPEIEQKIFLLPNAVDEKKFFPKKPSAHLRNKYFLSGNKVILTVARLSSLEQYKGYDAVIKALPAVIQEIPSIKYLLVGPGDEEEILRIRNLVNELNLQKYVILTGYVREEDLIDYYNLCDIFLMPSTREGFGFVFLEALACGKPVVAGSEDGSRDALLDGELGTLVNPCDAKEIAQAIIKVLKGSIQESLLDSSFLRKRVLGAYGFDKFKSGVAALVSIIDQ